MGGAVPRIAARDVCVTYRVLNVPDYNIKRSTIKYLARRRTRPTSIRALDHVDLQLGPGDRLGLVGANGAGKTTLLSVLAGTLPVTSGDVARQGRVLPLLGGGAAGLDPELSGTENILGLGLLLGQTPEQMRTLMPAISEFSGLGERLASPVYTYSTGMSARLRFAIITSLRPDILVMDEGIGSADAAFTAAAATRLHDFLASAGILVLASHSEALLRAHCTRAAWLDAGRLQALGDLDTVLAAYRADHRSSSPAAHRPSSTTTSVPRTGSRLAKPPPDEPPVGSPRRTASLALIGGIPLAGTEPLRALLRASPQCRLAPGIPTGSADHRTGLPDMLGYVEQSLSELTYRGLDARRRSDANIAVLRALILGGDPSWSIDSPSEDRILAADSPRCEALWPTFHGLGMTHRMALIYVLPDPLRAFRAQVTAGWLPATGIAAFRASWQRSLEMAARACALEPAVLVFQPERAGEAGYVRKWAAAANELGLGLPTSTTPNEQQSTGDAWADDPSAGPSAEEVRSTLSDLAGLVIRVAGYDPVTPPLAAAQHEVARLPGSGQLALAPGPPGG